VLNTEIADFLFYVMTRYSIRDLEKLTGIKAHTIRIWEKRYNVVEPSRTLTNIRYYSDEDLKRLLNISLLNRYGYKISNIMAMSPEEVNRKLLDISKTESDHSVEVENLVLSMIDMDETRFDKILSSAIIKFGFEYTMLHVLNQFLEKIGVLWLTGTITPAQEHFVSNLIRQKLILAIDSQHSNLHENAKTFLLYLPEAEYHEMGLLYFNYLIKKHGHHVIYLGQNVPLSDLKEISEIKTVDYLFTSITCALPGNEIQEYIDSLSSLFPEKTLLIGGYYIKLSNPSLAKNMKRFDEAESFEEFLSSLASHN